MITEITAFTTAVSHFVNITKSIAETRDEIKLESLKLEFTTALMDIMQKQVNLTQSYQAELDANKALKEKIATYEKWTQESQRYVLHQPSHGVFVYTLKPECANGQPLHWLCAACFDGGKKSILQKLSRDSDSWVCPHNKEHHIDYTQYGSGFSG